ncbi:MAG: hypothetical protein H8D63_00920 [Parcubacteria group bacterium]|nr:hypothetical protein [Parcubacteria group bacterium]
MQHITHYLPSSRFVLAVALIAVIGIAVYSFTRPKERPIDTEPLLVITDEEREKISLGTEDTDLDGLSNWEEALWGTNPNVADSDGDGTGDGIEIAARRNPLVNAVDDTLEAYPIVPSDEAAGEGGSTRSDAVSRTFMSHLYHIGTEGNPTIEDISVLEDIISNEVAQNIPQNTYTEEDIVVDTITESSTLLRTYANTLASFILAYDELGAPYEVAIITDAIESGNLSRLSDLKRFITFFTDMHDALFALSVPSTLIDTHLEILNTLQTMAMSLTYIHDMSDDTVIGLTGLTTYQTSLTRMEYAAQSLVGILSDASLTFSESEVGSMFAL